MAAKQGPFGPKIPLPKMPKPKGIKPVKMPNTKIAQPPRAQRVLKSMYTMTPRKTKMGG